MFSKSKVFSLVVAALFIAGCQTAPKKETVFLKDVKPEFSQAFKDAMKNSCIEVAMGELPPSALKAVTEYCECTAQKSLDFVSVEDINAISLDDPKSYQRFLKKLKPELDKIAAICMKR